MVRLDCAGSVGAAFNGVTTTVNEFVALMGGVPVSVTTVVMKLVLGAWFVAGVQVITPLALMAAPAGGDIN